MTLAKTKQRLVQILQDNNLKVIALSGEWGCGKTSLWDQIQREANDPKIRNARYVSLFGVRDISQLKLKLVQSILPAIAQSNTLSEGMVRLWRTGKDALKKIHPAFTAMDALALVAVPAALHNQFVVIDDLERKNSALDVDEILGFVDEYSKRFGTRFLLILNSAALELTSENSLWSAFREKVIDEEIRLSPKPSEAFDIAVSDLDAPYRSTVKKSVEICGVTNIRVIRIAYRLVCRLIGNQTHLVPAVLKRTIPSIVLISATYNRAIKDGPSLDFIKNFNRGSGGWLDDLSDRNFPSSDDGHLASWKMLMPRLGISSSDEFEELVVRYVHEGDREIETIQETIVSYISNERRIAAQNAAWDLIEKIRWEVSTADSTLVLEAENLVDQVIDMDAATISTLHHFVSGLEKSENISEVLIDTWINHFENSAPVEMADVPSVINEGWHPRLKDAVMRVKNQKDQQITLAEVVLGLVGRNGWGNVEEGVLRSATVIDFMNAMRTLRGQEFKLFVLKSLDILEQGQAYENYFGNAGQNFLEACREIVQCEGSSRFGRLLREVFSESKVPELLLKDLPTA